MGMEANEKRAGHLKVGDEAPSPRYTKNADDKGRYYFYMWLLLLDVFCPPHSQKVGCLINENNNRIIVIDFVVPQ